MRWSGQLPVRTLDVPDLTDLDARLRRLEDEARIQRLLMSYGPAADAGLSGYAAGLWLEDGEYDWDANGEAHRGSTSVDSMLQSKAHRQLMSEGVAHFGGPLLIEVDGDRATALNYSLIMRREEQRFYLWRVSAVRWDLERSGPTWRVRRRTNRLLDQTGAGRELFGNSLQTLFPGGPR
jgi:SnoaL-like domain